MIKRKKYLSLLLVSALLLSTETPFVIAAEITEASSNITQSSNNYSDSSIVNITDKYLKAAVLKALNKSDDYAVTVSDLKTITKLEANSDYIEDISPLQYCTNLETLYINIPADGNIAALSNLTKLTELRLTVQKHLDYSVLTNLKNLRSLVLISNANYISNADLSFLNKLNNLTELNLCGNNAYNLNPICSLTNLTSFTLSAPNTDISPIENLVNLKTLNLSQCKNPNLLPLSKLTNLETLSVTRCGISDIKALNSLTNLKSLNLNSNAIYDLSQISDILKTLTYFTANSQQIEFKDIEYFDRFQTSNIVRDETSQFITPSRISNNGSYISSTNTVLWKMLVGVDRVSYNFSKSIPGTKTIINAYYQDPELPGKFSGTVEYKLIEKEPENDQVVSIKDLNLYSKIIKALNKEDGYVVTKKDLESIEKLDLRYNSKIKDISPLKYCTNIKCLNISLDKTANIEDLSDLNSLSSLSISVPVNTDISSLGNLTNLETLSLSGGDYYGNYRNTDISFLSNLTKLTNLTLSSNNVIDISPLSNLTNLTYLSLHENTSDISPLSALKNLTTLRISSDRKITDISPLVDLTNLETLYANKLNLNDISPLSNLDKLKDLGLVSCNVNDISPLSSLSNLKILNLESNAISDISPLKDLFKTLEEFSAEGQVINGGSGEYYDSFYAPNIIYDENSELLAPYKVSNCGYYNEETKTACWDRLCGIKKVSYYFSKKIDDCKTIYNGRNEDYRESSKFSGYVVYSLTETF